MQIFPHAKHEWLRASLLPFKAYVVIAPTLFLISVDFHPYRRFPCTDFEVLLAGLSFLDMAILLLAALLFAVSGPRGFALPAIGFGVAASVVGEYLLVSCAR